MHLEDEESLKPPFFDQDLIPTDSYYHIKDEKIIFVNVERDFVRIAPLLEAAIGLSKNNKVYFFDLARPSFSIQHRMLNMLKEVSRGGWIPNLVREYLEEMGIRYVDWLELKNQKKISNFRISSQDKYLIMLAKRNQNIESFPSVTSTESWYLDHEENLSSRISFLISIFRKYEIDRAFCWNGRFILSTLVDIACRNAGVQSSVVEMGSELLQVPLFEIFRTNPWDFQDTYSRMKDLKARQSIGIHSSYDEDEITHYFQAQLGNSFTKNFHQSEEVPEYDVVYFTSSLHELGTRPGYFYSEKLQFDLVEVVSKVCKELGLTFCIRVHPNPDTPNYQRWETEQWETLNKIKLQYYADVVPGNSSLSSYSLAQLSKFNICFQSTLGLELYSLNMPILMINPELDPPLNHEHFIRWCEFRVRKFFSDTSGLTASEFQLLANYHYFCRGFAYKYFKEVEGGIYFQNSRLTFERGTSSKLLKYLYKFYRNLKFDRALKDETIFS